jgi:hypothetical protein
MSNESESDDMAIFDSGIRIQMCNAIDSCQGGATAGLDQLPDASRV